MNELKKQIQEVQNELSQLLESVSTADQLEALRVSFIGRKGKISALMATIKNLSVDEKRIFGPLLNKLKKSAEEKISQKKDQLSGAQQELAALKQKFFDVSAYKPNTLDSSLHIYTKTIEHIKDIFISMGYDVADGPEAETDYYNFQALNIPHDHPARDMQDTFWLNVPDMLLRTHTSSVQIHELEKKGAPISLVSLGRVYRHEATDASHDFMFSQYEGLLVNKGISVSNLLATLKTFLQELFEKKDLKVRVRPGYFPFVEPGLEVDASCPFCKEGCSVCKKTGWIELMGAGLVHPNVLKACGIDPEKYSGFAFGGGIERLAMIKHGINDIRLFHSGSVEFLKQF